MKSEYNISHLNKHLKQNGYDDIELYDDFYPYEESSDDDYDDYEEDFPFEIDSREIDNESSNFPKLTGGNIRSTRS